MIYLRAADRFDVRSLAELRAAGLVEQGLLPLENRVGFIAAATRAFGALFRAERIAAWIACDGDTVVGSSCAVFYDRLPYPEGSRHAEVCGVYVMPAYRKRGFASELVRETLAAVQASGARKTYLRPVKTAKALYARLGFVDADLMAFEHTTHAAAPASELGGEPVLAALPAR